MLFCFSFFVFFYQNTYYIIFHRQENTALKLLVALIKIINIPIKKFCPFAFLSTPKCCFLRYLKIIIVWFLFQNDKVNKIANCIICSSLKKYYSLFILKMQKFAEKCRESVAEQYCLLQTNYSQKNSFTNR